ncbi:MAG: hypothetical protein GX190_01270 [Mollicutes bacterium]|nr:hypothetical protein [Mollicutes bacterium]
MKKKLIKFLIFVFFVVVLIYGYAYFIGTKGLIVKEIKITNKNIPNYFHGLKIAHISDVHYGRIINDKNIETIVKKINLLKPDIVVITGDLLDRDRELSEENKKTLIENLNKIEVTIGKYAIAGNHDYVYGINQWEKIIEESNFINLNDTYDLVYNNGTTPILINGMSSNLQNKTTINEKLKEVQKILKEEKNKPIYNIMIMHEPDYIEKFEYEQFDLILAGHSHNGQIKIPLIGAIVTPVGAKKYYDEYYNLGKTDLYISSGLGTSGYDIRLFNKPSFNFYRITNK